MAELKDPAMTVMAKAGTMNAMKNASRSSPVPKIDAIRRVEPSEASFTAALSHRYNESSQRDPSPHGRLVRGARHTTEDARYCLCRCPASW